MRKMHRRTENHDLLENLERKKEERGREGEKERKSSWLLYYSSKIIIISILKTNKGKKSCT